MIAYPTNNAGVRDVKSRIPEPIIYEISTYFGAKSIAQDERDYRQQEFLFLLALFPLQTLTFNAMYRSVSHSSLLHAPHAVFPGNLLVCAAAQEKPEAQTVVYWRDEEGGESKSAHKVAHRAITGDEISKLPRLQRFFNNANQENQDSSRDPLLIKEIVGFCQCPPRTDHQAEQQLQNWLSFHYLDDVCTALPQFSFIEAVISLAWRNNPVLIEYIANHILAKLTPEVLLASNRNIQEGMIMYDYLFDKKQLLSQWLRHQAPLPLREKFSTKIGKAQSIFWGLSENKIAAFKERERQEEVGAQVRTSSVSLGITL